MKLGESVLLNQIVGSFFAVDVTPMGAISCDQHMVARTKMALTFLFNADTRRTSERRWQAIQVKPISSATPCGAIAADILS